MRELIANRRRFVPVRQKHVIARIQAFAPDNSGATAIEYGLIIAIIASVILVFTADVQSGFEGLAKAITSGFGS